MSNHGEFVVIDAEEQSRWEAALGLAAIDVTLREDGIDLAVGDHVTREFGYQDAVEPQLDQPGVLGLIEDAGVLIAMRVLHGASLRDTARTEWCVELSRCAVELVRDRAATGDRVAAHRLAYFIGGHFRVLVAVRGHECFKNELAFEARRVREEWADLLLASDDEAPFALLSGEDRERELRRLVFVDPDRPLEPLGLVPHSAQTSPYHPANQQFQRAIVREGLLPRFDLRSSALLMWKQISAPARILGALAVAAGLAGVLVALIVGTRTGVNIGAVLAAGGFAAVAAAVVVGGEAASYPLLLRLPAGAALGLTALILPVGAVWAPLVRTWWVAVLLAAASLTYLVVEAGVHCSLDSTSTTRRRIAVVGRAAMVFAIGAVHAVLVVCIGFAINSSAFDPDGVRRSVLTGAAACLAVGIFAQVLWDDRPVTYPLSHVPGRRRR